MVTCGTAASREAMWVRLPTSGRGGRSPLLNLLTTTRPIAGDVVTRRKQTTGMSTEKTAVKPEG